MKDTIILIFWLCVLFCLSFAAGVIYPKTSFSIFGDEYCKEDEPSLSYLFDEFPNGDTEIEWIRASTSPMTCNDIEVCHYTGKCYQCKMADDGQLE